MSWTKKILSLHITLFLLLLTAEGQNVKKQSLLSIIQFLEEKYEIAFTYADENIEGIELVFPDSLDLNQSLQFLNENLTLTFNRLDNRYVAITPAEYSSRKICGYLLDAETNEPVYASIRSYANDKVESIVNSDNSGYFEMETSRDSDLKIESLGYSSLAVKESEFTNCIKLRMSPENLVLEEVVVSNFLTEGINKLNNGSFSIQTQELGILPGLIEQDVLQTIQVLPGIQSINEQVADINARGGTNDQNLILWDGIRMYQTGHFFGLISAFNPYLTEKVTFIKNGSPASYTNGISSTIDIRNSDRVSESFSGGIGMNLINADLYTKVPLSDKASLQVSARRSISDLFQTLTYQQYFDRVFANTEVTSPLSSDGATEVETSNEEFFFRDLSVKLLFDPSPKDKLRINFLQIKNEISFQENAQIDSVTETQTSSLEQDNISAGLEYTRLWNSKFKTRGFGYYTQYNLRGIDFDVINDQRLVQENEVIETGLEFDAEISLNSRSSIKAGYQFYETGIGNLEELNNPEFRRYIKRVMRIHSAFTEYSYAHKGFSTTLGLRGNYYNRLEEFVIEPRLSVRQNITPSLAVELLGEMKSQSSTQIIDLQNDFLGIEKRRWIMADGRDIPLMENQQISLGFIYQKHGLLVSLEGYMKEVDGIAARSQGFQNQFQFARAVGGYTAKGMDFLLNYKSQKLSSWFTYSYAENIYNFDQLRPPEFPSNLDIPHSVGIGVNYTLNKLELSTGWKWRTGIPFSEPVDGNEVVNGTINFGPPNAERLDDYSRLDFSVKYRLDLNPGKNLEFGLSIWNVLDKKNILNQYYTLDSNDELDIIQQSSLGITPNLMVRFNFN